MQSLPLSAKIRMTEYRNCEWAERPAYMAQGGIWKGCYLGDEGQKPLDTFISELCEEIRTKQIRKIEVEEQK